MSWDEDEVRAALEALARAQGQDEAQVAAYVEAELPRLRRQQAEGYPWGRAEPHTTRNDPSVFARLDFVDVVAGREWRVTGQLAKDSTGRLVIRNVTVAPWLALPGREPEGHDVTTTVLRGLHIARIRDLASQQLWEARGQLDVGSELGWPLPEPTEAEAIRRAAASAEAPVPKPGRAGFGDDFYRQLATRYLALLEERTRTRRTRRGIRAELAHEFRLAPTQIRDAVAKARETGWLTPGTPGRADASPGPRLLEPTKKEESE